MTIFEDAYVVGMYHRGAQVRDIVSTFDGTETLTLKREPDNRFDAYAIQVYYQDIHIGYINSAPIGTSSEGTAAWLAPELDALIEQNGVEPNEDGLLDVPSSVEVTISHFDLIKNNNHPVLRIVVPE